MSLKGKNILIDVGLALFPTYRKVLVLHARERKEDLVVKGGHVFLSQHSSEKFPDML